jgi:hypothetical protein
LWQQPDAVLDEILRTDDLVRIQPPHHDVPANDRRRGTARSGPGEAELDLRERDEAVFGDPNALDPRANSGRNLVYGIGRHACPGRLLATLEMRIVVRELLAATTSIALDPQQPAERAVSPVGGWTKVPVVLT